jgi:1-acyl-sn-glycerol-3-phosphate acyltransferase
MIWLRSCLFWLLLILFTIPCGIILPLSALFLPFSWRLRLCSFWRAGFMGLAHWILGVRMRLIGLENRPEKPVLVLSKHQSAWETVAFQGVFYPLAFVLKRELLWIPFFGWGLASVRMIGIDRSAGLRALKQILKDGQDRLAQGMWVVVFPEGTRVLPGQSAPYKPGAAYLAIKTGTPILPVAHNAGLTWPKKAFLVHPGTITISIGPLIETKGKKDAEVNAAAKAWIDAETARLEQEAQAPAVQ